MKQQVEAFEAAFAAFDDYAAMLSAAAYAVRNGDQSDDLIVSLIRDEADVLPADMVDRLQEGALKAAEARPFVIKLLCQAKALDAWQNVISRARSLDRKLESTLDLQSPPHARVPPPYIFFEQTKKRMEEAFPFEIDDPIWTPELVAFQRFLESPQNPWCR